MLYTKANLEWLQKEHGQDTDVFLYEKNVLMGEKVRLVSVSWVTDGNGLTFYRCIIDNTTVYDLVYEESINAWMDINSEEVSETTEALGNIISAA